MADFFLYFAIIATVIMCFAGLMMGIYRATHNYGNFQPMTEKRDKIPVGVVTTTGEAIHDKGVAKTEESLTTTPITVLSESTEDVSEKQWLEQLKEVHVDGVTYSPSELISARQSIFTYWKRAFISKTEEAQNTNRKKAIDFKNVLEKTGLIIEFYDDGTGKVFI